jgi:uncharacterized RDD family membrane protein YckC
MGDIIRAMNEVTPAGFWIRALAFVIDVMVLAIVQASYDLAASLVFGADPERSLAVAGTVSLFTVVFAALYTTVLHATAGQTLGKLVTGVRVVALDGDPPPGGAAFLRWLAYFLSFATVGLGFLMAGLRADKRALHDLVAGTRVERVARTRRHRETENMGGLDGPPEPPEVARGTPAEPGRPSDPEPSAPTPVA